MKKIFLIVCSITSVIVYAKPIQVPQEVIEDGFSEAAERFLIKHPKIGKCADKMAKDNRKDRRKLGLGERTTYAEYGEFIGVCAEKYR